MGIANTYNHLIVCVVFFLLAKNGTEEKKHGIVPRKLVWFYPMQ